MTTVEAWVVDGSTEVDGACLSRAELANASAMRSPAVTTRHLRARALLRHALARHLHTAPAAVPLAAPSTGAPRLGTPHGPATSLSHAGDVVAVALRPDGPVGIDVEVAGIRRRPVPAVALAPERLDAVAGTVPDHLAPLAVWVLLEAALKADGTGFAQPQQHVRFTPVPGGVRLDLPSGRHGGVLRVLPEDVVVAVAAPGAVPEVHWQPASLLTC